MPSPTEILDRYEAIARECDRNDFEKAFSPEFCLQLLAVVRKAQEACDFADQANLTWIGKVGDTRIGKAKTIVALERALADLAVTNPRTAKGPSAPG